jgi:uncharacterized membrane protein
VFAAIVVVGLIAVPLALWGMLAPRSQWRALASWQYRHPEANEPSDAAYAIQRVSLALLMIVLVVLGYRAYAAEHDTAETERAKATQRAAQAEAAKRWPGESGSPSTSVFLRDRPEVVATAAPHGEAEPIPLTGYAPLDPAARRPAYLWTLATDTAISRLGTSDDLVIGSDSACVPESVVVTESSAEIRIAAFAAASPPGTPILRVCTGLGSAVWLYPVDLSAPVGERRVVHLATGAPLPRTG